MVKNRIPPNNVTECKINIFVMEMKNECLTFNQRSKMNIRTIKYYNIRFKPFIYNNNYKNIFES